MRCRSIFCLYCTVSGCGSTTRQSLQSLHLRLTKTADCQHAPCSNRLARASHSANHPPPTHTHTGLSLSLVPVWQVWSMHTRPCNIAAQNITRNPLTTSTLTAQCATTAHPVPKLARCPAAHAAAPAAVLPALLYWPACCACTGLTQPPKHPPGPHSPHPCLRCLPAQLQLHP